MKFVKLTETDGLPVYLSETMIVSALTQAAVPAGSLIRSEAGLQKVRETPAEVVAMLEAAL